MSRKLIFRGQVNPHGGSLDPANLVLRGYIQLIINNFQDLKMPIILMIFISKIYCFVYLF